MSMYSKSSCPKCRSTLKSWHRSYVTFGNPFVRCQSCGIMVRMSHINEWEAMPIFSQVWYYLLFYGQAILYGGMSAVILGLIFDGIFETGVFVVGNNPTVVHMVLIIITAVAVLIWRHIKFQQAIRESVDRTKDLTYRQMLGIK